MADIGPCMAVEWLNERNSAILAMMDTCPAYHIKPKNSKA